MQGHGTQLLKIYSMNYGILQFSYSSESLLQMNVFLDNLNVLKKTQYVAALTILDPNQSEPQPDLPNQSRAAQWVWKRKVRNIVILSISSLGIARCWKRIRNVYKKNGPKWC